MRRKSDSGQATIEYLFVLLFLMFISWQFFKFVGLIVGNQIGGLGYELSNHLATGVCKKNCLYTGFENGIF